MKALKIMMFLLLLNVSFWALGQMGIWPVTGPAGLDPTHLGSINAATLSQQTGVSATVFNVLGNSVFTIEGFLVILGIAVGAGFFTQANITKIVGVISFSVLFLWFYMNSLSILTVIHMPPWLVMIFTGFNFIFLMLGLIQLATGTSFKNMW